MTSPPRFYEQMAPFWDFIADLNEQGPPRGWFGRRGGANRAAARGENTEANNEVPNPWTQGGAGFPFGPMPHRHRHGHGHGPARRQARRQQQAEAAVENEKTEVLTPETETEKPVEAEKFPIVVQSEGEAQSSEAEQKRGPGARGGRGGRGGRGQGMGRARRIAMREAKQAETVAEAPSDTEKTLSGDESKRAAGPRRGGRGGRGMGRGAARGAQQGMGRGLFQGMGPRRRRALIQALHAEMLAYEATLPHQHGRQGAVRGMRGGRGAGMGRGRGAAMARNLGLARGLQDQQAAHGLRQGPGPHRGGPNARGRGFGNGRGRGAGFGGPARGGAAFAQNLNARLAAAAVPLRNGPAFRRQNQGLAHQGPKRPQNHGQRKAPGAGPKAREGSNKGPAGLRKQHAGAAAGPAKKVAGAAKKHNGPFRPVVDVYHHPEAYIIHAVLPGAKKEDIEVDWNSEKSVISITGRVERPVSEELLKTLVVKERRSGAFQRKVKLPPTLIDAEGITAKMENGLLVVEVPRLDSFVEVKKIDIN